MGELDIWIGGFRPIGCKAVIKDMVFASLLMRTSTLGDRENSLLSLRGKELTIKNFSLHASSDDVEEVKTRNNRAKKRVVVTSDKLYIGFEETGITVPIWQVRIRY